MVVEKLDKRHHLTKYSDDARLNIEPLRESEKIERIASNSSIINFWNDNHNSEFVIKIKISTVLIPYILDWQLKPDNDNLVEIAVITRSIVEKGKKAEVVISFPVNQIHSGSQYWHLILKVGNHQSQDYYVTIDNSNWKTKIKLLPDGYRYAKNYKDEVVYPTIQANMNFVIEARRITKYEQFKYIKRSWLVYVVVLICLPLIRYLNIWVFFEKNAASAHENAWITFKKMREMYPKRLIYYALNSDAKKKLTTTDKNIIILGTWKYYIILYLSKLLVSSETRYHVLGDSQFHRSMLMNKLSKKAHIFLQHGMNGIKDVPMFHYGHGQIDFMIAASNWEKAMIVKEWHYPENRVFVTGLPRWDDLIPDILLPNVITFVPTWQSSITNLTQEMFQNTDFFRTYKALFESSQFINYINQNNVDINLILHPKLLHYSKLFEKIKHVTIHVNSDITPLISKSETLVTDYSSIAWDSLYLGRKVIFFRHDNMHDDGLNVNALGTVVNDSSSLISALRHSSSNNQSNLESYFEPRSVNNTQRVIEKLIVNQKKFKIHTFTYLNRKLWERIKR